MTHFAGLDVSLEETAICVVDETGRIIKETRAVSEPQTLIAALTALGLPLERVGLEACSLTAWLHDDLRAAGLPAICIETRQANAAMKTMPNKTDRNDARALAQIIAPAGTDRSTSSRASPGSGARSWWRAARCSTRCARSRTWCGPSCARAGSSSARQPAQPLPDACAN
jgi:transposase